MTANDKRCVVTGLGMICAIGNNVEETWKNAMAGVSGIKNATSVDTEGCYATLGAEVNDDTLGDVKNADDMDRVSQLCVKAADEAIKDAGIVNFDGEEERVSVIIGSCVGGVVSVENYYKNGKKTSDITKMPISAIANQVAHIYGAKGTVTNIGNACAAGTISIAYACDLIRAGKCDVVIAGGADAFASVPFAGFISLHALAANGCSPFNHCDGITLGEGSGVVIIESYEHAQKRNAKMYCEVLGSGITSDAHHITAPREDGEGQMNAIRRAIKSSGVSENDVDYINAHGTGTAKNDMAEFLSVHTIFDGKNDHLSVSSTKAMVGHCLGAAGAIEAVFAIKAMTEGMVPATLGYSEEDLVTLAERAGDIDFTPNTAKEKQMDTVVNNSFAFGGNNASVIFSKNAGEVEYSDDNEIVITGLGIVNAIGNGLDNYVEKINGSVAPESNSNASKVEKEDFDNAGLKMAFYRKLDQFSQIQAVSGVNAISDAGIEVTDDNAFDIGVIVGTAAGPLTTICDFQQNLLEHGNAAGSAFKFPNTVYNAAGGYLTICSGIKGYTATVTNGSQAGVQSVAYATQMLREGKNDIILATGTDENSEIMTELYTKLGQVSDSTCEPYSDSSAYTLGDGSTTLVLETKDSAAKRGAKAYAVVKGYGMYHEPVAFDDMKVNADAVAAVIKAALSDAGVEASEIDAIVGFGNGMAVVDDGEIAGYQAAFGESFTQPVFNIKGVTGEGHAATATLSVGHAALLLSGRVNGTCVYTCENGKMVNGSVETAGLKKVIVCAHGMGGNYSAVVLEKAE